MSWRNAEDEEILLSEQLKKPFTDEDQGQQTCQPNTRSAKTDIRKTAFPGGLVGRGIGLLLSFLVHAQPPMFATTHNYTEKGSN